MTSEHDSSLPQTDDLPEMEIEDGAGYGVSDDSDDAEETVAITCPVCGLVYQRNAGDTWAFWIIGDRIPVAMAIAVVYFGVGPHTWAQGALFFAAIAIALVATIPQRMGFVIALDYLSRRYWPDLDDPSSITPEKGKARMISAGLEPDRWLESVDLLLLLEDGRL